jgi:hypothetical protein
MYGIEAAQDTTVEHGGCIEQFVVELDDIESSQQLARPGHSRWSMAADRSDDFHSRERTSCAGGIKSQCTAKRCGFRFRDHEFDQR